MKCFGRNLPDHCCYINDKPCPFLEKNTKEEQLWSCQLRRETGSWEAAIVDPRYDTGEGSPGHAFRNTPYKNCEIFQCDECGQLERGEIDQTQYEALKSQGHRLGK